MVDKKVALEKLPGYSIGVRENSAQRMINLARPICPFSKITMELDSNGRPARKEGISTPNCQLAGKGWWDDCADRGHDPYFTTYKWYTEEDILEPDEQGRLVKTGVHVIPHEQRMPNVAQVAATTRINNGRGPQEAIENKGFKRLRDIGFDEVCQFRNCQKPITPEGTSRKYGLFCSKQHLALIGADYEEVALDQPNVALSGETATKLQKRRERTLNEVLMGA
jgi:hypothetical protein